MRSGEPSAPTFEALAELAEKLLQDADETVATQLEQIAEETNSWPLLADVYRKLASRPLSLAHQIDIRFRLGTVYAERLNDPERALRTFQRLLDLQQGHAGALDALEALLARLERWQELAQLLEAQCKTGAADRALAAHLRLAEVLERHLGQQAVAADIYARTLQLEPDQPEAIAQLERLFREGHAPISAADVVEPFLEARGEWRRLTALLEARLRVGADRSERIVLLERIANMRELRLLDSTSALEAWAELLLEHPEPEAVAEQMERIASSGGTFQIIAVSFGALVEQTGLTVEVRHRFLQRLGAARKLIGEDEAAVAAYQQALAIDPADVHSLEELCGLYDRLGQHPLLVSTLRRRVELTSGWESAEPLWLWLAELYESKLLNLTAATDCCNRVLERSPANSRAFECLERIYTAGERWPELLDLYERWVEFADDAVRANLYVQMAQLATDRIRDDARALALWERAFALRTPRDADWAAVVAIHERTGNWSKLVAALEARLPLNRSSSRKLELYLQIARVKESRLRDLHGAIGVFEQIQAIDSEHLECLKSLARLYHVTESWARFVDTAWKMIRLTIGAPDASTAQLIEELSELARVADEHLNNSRMAIEAARQLLDLDPDHVSALRRSTRLLAKEQRWAECAEMLERQAGAVVEPEGQVEALREAASICEARLGDRQRAVALWERVRTVAPRDEEAGIELERLYRQASAWQLLAPLLEERARQRLDDPCATTWFADAAELFEHALGDPTSAYRALVGVLNVHAEFEPKLEDLERLAESLHAWQDLANAYRALAEQLAERPEQADRSAAVWLRLGRICSERLYKKREALAAVQAAVRVMPDDVKAQDILVELLREQHRWQDLGVELRAQADRAREPERKQSLLWQLAEILEIRMTDSSAAAAAYREIIAGNPDSTSAIEKLERIYRRQLDWSGVVDVLGRRAALSLDLEEQLKLQLEQARLLSMKLRDADRAAAAYEAALALDPLCLEAIRVLCEHHRKVGPPERYLELLELEAQVVDSDRARATVYEKMATVYETQCSDEANAAACLEKLLAIEPNNPNAYRRLERFYSKTQDWRALIETYSRHLAILNNDTVWAEVRRSMASVYEEKLGDLNAALAVYEDVARRTGDRRATAKVASLKALLGE